MSLQIVADSPAFLKWEHDWLVSCLAHFEPTVVVDPQLQVTGRHAMLVVSGGLTGRVDRIRASLREATARGCRVGLIHLSDEYGSDPLDLYHDVPIVIRNYWRADAAAFSHCILLPLGYRSGFGRAVRPEPFARRTAAWAFLGEPKLDRQQMLDTFSRWAEGFTHLTGRWDDPVALPPECYAEILSRTRLAPCPTGNSSPESFRLYEALEAGAVPIVQDSGGGGMSTLWPTLCRVAACGPRLRGARPYLRRTFGPSYWSAQYGSKFPVPVVRYWEQLPKLLRETDWAGVAAATSGWWRLLKQQVRVELAARLNERLFA